MRCAGAVAARSADPAVVIVRDETLSWRRMSDRFAGFDLERVHGVPVLTRRDERFQTFRCSLVLRRPFGVDVAARALLPALLLQGTTTDPGRVPLARRMERLYGAAALPAITKSGETHVLRFTLDAVAGEALPGRPDVLGEGLGVLRDIALSPRLEGDAFPADTFARERRQQADSIRTIADDKGSLAFERVCALACAGEPFAIPDHGGLENVLGLQARDPEHARADFLAHGQRLVVAHGRVSSEEVRAGVSRLLDEVPRAAAEPVPEPSLVPRRDARHTVERSSMQQAHLWLVHRFATRRTLASWPARRLCAQVLGGGPHSRLFREVREKRSLCYSIGASPERAKDLLFVHTSLDERSVAECETLVAAELARLARGELDPADLEAAKATMRSGLRAVDDSVQGRIGFTIEQWFQGSDETPEELAARYARVTAAEVVAAAAELWLDHVYLLAPNTEVPA